MSSAVEKYVLERIADTPIQYSPSPHFFIEGIFPDDVYDDLRANLPSNDDYIALSETGRVMGDTFKRRFVFFPTKEAIETLPQGKQTFWRDMHWLYEQPLLLALCRKFPNALRNRFGDDPRDVVLEPEILVVRDRDGFEIGPHTDAPHRFLSLLFYCPPDNEHEHLGTSLYMPRERGFTCEGGPHHPFDEFVRVSTVPYRRNCLFGFLKTSNSFHGVEEVTDKGIERDIMLYSMRITHAQEATSAAPR